jgi:hypothetical protein
LTRSFDYWRATVRRTYPELPISLAESRRMKAYLLCAMLIANVALLSVQQTSITKTTLQFGQRAPDFALLSDKCCQMGWEDDD